jgi:hypothetical protein
VQGVHIVGGGIPISAGFYDVPTSAQGCTWTYAGSCSLALCDANAGLVAASAGVITFTVGTTSATVTPSGTGTYPSTAPPSPLTPGTTAQVSAAGATVPAFTSGSLTMPAPLQVTSPADGATINTTQPFTFTWAPVAGDAYINLSQDPTSAPYPSGNTRTIRCEVPAQDGMVTIAVELVGQLVAGTNNVTATASALAAETQDVGNYEVTVRLIALDASRRLNVQ